MSDHIKTILSKLLLIVVILPDNCLYKEFQSIQEMTEYVSKNTIQITTPGGPLEYTYSVGLDLTNFDSKTTYTMYLDKTNMRQSTKKLVDSTNG